MGLNKKKILKKELLFVFACFLLYFFWSYFFSGCFYEFYGPDEIARYQIISFIVRTSSLPTGWEPELIMHPWGFSYGLDIKLPYLLSAFFVKIVSCFSCSETVLITAARFTSVLSGTGVVLFSIILSKQVFHNDSCRWIFVFLMSLLPQVVFLSSYFNLDIFSLFSVMIIIDSWLKGVKEDWSYISCTQLAIGMGLCLVSYSFAYGYLVGSLLIYIVSCIKNKNIKVKKFILKGIYMLIIVFIISGWMIVRNYIVHDGDIFASNTRYVQAELYADPEYLPSNSYKGNGYSIIYMLLHSDFIELSYRSLICVIGSMAIRGSIAMYAFFTAVIIVGIVGFCKSRKDDTILYLSIFGGISSVIPIALSVYYSWSVDYEPQGRYIITIIPILFIVVSKGLKYIIDKYNTKTKNVIITIICTATVVFSLEAFINCGRYFNSF